MKTSGTHKVFEDLTVTVADGAKVNKKNLSELCGPSGLVLYFYPKDNTPGCTTEACDFRDNMSVLKKLGYGIAGVSMDSAASHQSFTKKQKLNFPLIADEDRKLSITTGAYGKKNLYGKIRQGIKRTTFILSPKLEVLEVYENVRAKGHAEKVVSALSE